MVFFILYSFDDAYNMLRFIIQVMIKNYRGEVRVHGLRTVIILAYAWYWYGVRSQLR